MIVFYKMYLEKVQKKAELKNVNSSAGVNSTTQWGSGI